MILQLSCKSHGIGLQLPAPASDVKQTLFTLRDGLAKDAPVRISGLCSNANILHRYIRHADLEDADDLQKLNQLAELFDGISGEEQQHLLSGALDAESINCLDDVLRVASSLAQYELIQGVTSDKELGGWLVEHGLAGVDFPESVRPYLDYAGIGAEYYSSHGGAYTPNGYVKRRENAQIQAASNKPAFALTLASSFGSLRLDLPATDSELEQAVSVLQVSCLDRAMIEEVHIGYPWAYLLPESLTADHANALARYVSTMSETELRTFGAALEVEEPDTFSDAVCIAEDLDNYELVAGSEGEYGRETLRYAGAGDEILEMLDGFTDFDALGRFEMEQDGVRETSFGSVKRLTSPFPQQTEQGQMMY